MGLGKAKKRMLNLRKKNYGRGIQYTNHVVQEAVEEGHPEEVEDLVIRDEEDLETLENLVGNLKYIKSRVGLEKYIEDNKDIVNSLTEKNKQIFLGSIDQVFFAG